jgi:hypothetical protein
MKVAAQRGEPKVKGGLDCSNARLQTHTHNRAQPRESTDFSVCADTPAKATADASPRVFSHLRQYDDDEIGLCALFIPALRPG